MWAGGYCWTVSSRGSAAGGLGTTAATNPQRRSGMGPRHADVRSTQAGHEEERAMTRRRKQPKRPAGITDDMMRFAMEMSTTTMVAYLRQLQLHVDHGTMTTAVRVWLTLVVQGRLG